MNETLSVRVLGRPSVAIYPPGATFGPRAATSWEFVWLLEGHALYRYENARERGELELSGGQLLLCRPSERDWFTWDETRCTRHGFFHFALASEGANTNDWPRLRPMRDDDLYTPLVRHLLTLCEHEDAQRDLTATLLLSAFVSGQSTLGDVPAQQFPEPVERAFDWLYARLDEDASTPISLDTLARVAYVSPEHLCRLFKTSTDRSPLEVVRLARLDRAALLLSRTNFSVGQIAHLTGFASPFHFSRAFKEAYGASPRDLRKSLKRGESLPSPRLLRTWRPQK